jgi:hypothetical protein
MNEPDEKDKSLYTYAILIVLDAWTLLKYIVWLDWHIQFVSNFDFTCPWNGPTIKTPQRENLRGKIRWGRLAGPLRACVD